MTGEMTMLNIDSLTDRAVTDRELSRARELVETLLEHSGMLTPGREFTMVNAIARKLPVDELVYLFGYVLWADYILSECEYTEYLERRAELLSRKVEPDEEPDPYEIPF
jgi:hypothetical protein